MATFFFSQCFFFGTATNKIANKMRKKKKFILHRAILCNDAVHAALVCTRVHVLTVRRHTATIQDMLELGRHQTSTSEQTTTTITTTTTTTTVGVRLSCFFLLDVHMHIRVCVCVWEGNGRIGYRTSSPIFVLAGLVSHGTSNMLVPVSHFSICTRVVPRQW